MIGLCSRCVRSFSPRPAKLQTDKIASSRSAHSRHTRRDGSLRQRERRWLGKLVRRRRGVMGVSFLFLYPPTVRYVHSILASTTARLFASSFMSDSLSYFHSKRYELGLSLSLTADCVTPKYHNIASWHGVQECVLQAGNDYVEAFVKQHATVLLVWRKLGHIHRLKSQLLPNRTTNKSLRSCR